MNLVDWILNIASVFLWIEWRSMRSAVPQSALSIGGTVRRAGGAPGQGLGALLGLLFIQLVRPMFYYTVGSAVNWIPSLDFLAISIPWRSDMAGRMYLYSMLSAGKCFGYYYAWLLLLSAVSRKVSNEDLMQRFVRGQLGFLEKVPWWIKPLLPAVAAGLSWLLLSKLFAALQLIPPGTPAKELWAQAGAVALAAVLAWKWLLVAFLLVHLLDLYLYIGRHPLWAYMSGTSRKLLFPFSFLRVGRMDLSPVAGLIAVFALSDWLLGPLALQLFRTYLR